MATLTLRHDAPTETGATIPKGAIVEYIGHVAGGMVKVRHNGTEEVIHPRTTIELSQ